MTTARHLHDLTPSRAADTVMAEAGDEWTRSFVAELGLRMHRESLEQFLSVWQISAAEAARVFGVSRQAVAQWRTAGVPGDRLVALADGSGATELLLRYVRPDRIPAVVRRPADVLGGASLLSMAQDGRTAEVRGAVVAMLDLRRVSP